MTYRVNSRFGSSKDQQKKTVQKKLQVKREWVKALERADLDGDGKISFEEFRNLLGGADCRAVFESLDKDRSGWLGKQEVRRFVNQQIKKSSKR